MRNKKLKEIESLVRSEEFSMTENPYHSKLLLEALEACDNRLFTADDVDITLQEIFVESELCEENEELQEVLSDRIYSLYQDIRSIYS